MKDGLNVFIGYDEREKEAYDVCRYSLARRAIRPVSITPLDEKWLRAKGYYTRTFTKAGNVKYDDIDHKPFSTDFAFSRFLVPFLMSYQGWAVFCDCDFLFRADINQILVYADPRKAAMVVKHNHVPVETIKMDGQRQMAYPRKNWSSFVLWNCAHPSNSTLTPDVVNSQTGRWLHGFSWLLDEEIGEIPLEWNWLAGVSRSVDSPNAVHFTMGIPTMSGYENSPYADEWREYEAQADRGGEDGSEAA